jgi:multicomponent Na+:H+ antiporter subunit C
MEALLAVVAGGLYAIGFYLMMRRNTVKMILGLAVLSHAVNLAIFTSGRLPRARPPVVPAGTSVLREPFADPLPQALILTAIVIAFGVQAFVLVLLRRAYEEVGNDDLDAMRATDT